ncbi:MAG: glycoside hydrolase [Gammaproteobacteria bacterium]|nr:glycoside hydrolase [Gammaproteobacteria bacterium]
MRKQKSFRQLIGLLFSAIALVMPVQVQSAEHKHATHGVPIPGACAKADTPASLQCARGVSSVFDSKGRLWLAWAFGGHVYVNFSDDKGKTYSSPVAINRTPEAVAAKAESPIKILVDRQGRIFISWTMKLAKRFSGHIRFSRSVDGGENFSAPLTVNDHLEVTSHRFQSMAINEAGDIFIAWLDKRDLLAAIRSDKPYTGAAVYYAYSDNHGQSFHPNIKVIDSSCECCRTAMAMDKDGLPVILWRHVFDKNTRDHALAKLLANDRVGKVRRASFDNWQVDGCPHHGPSISSSDEGYYHLTWFNNAPERHGLFYAYSKDQGKTFSSAISVGNYKAAASHPQVITAGETVYLLWKEFDGKQSSLITMQSVDKGKNWSEAEQLLQTTATNEHPLLLRDEQRVYAAWQRTGEDYHLIPLRK